MKIKFLGAAGTVTGSSYVLTSDSGQSILIDLGMFQGGAKIDQLNFTLYDYDCSKLFSAILTHAHLDHCGRLPILLKNGFKGDIWMTPATRDLTELSLLDSAKIAVQNMQEGKNTHGDILYDTDLALKTIEKFKTINYRTPFFVGDFTVTFRDAGHILGSAFLEVTDNKSQQ
jgi:Predicted exonuclease of the beta-lactamase fold involved in RNA processing